MVTGVITQNVDLLHTKAGSTTVVNLHGTYARVVCLGCGHTMTRAALAEQLEALNPGFVERAEAVGGIAVAPDADAMVVGHGVVPVRRLSAVRRHAQARHRLLRRERAQRPCRAGVFTCRRRRRAAGRRFVADGVLRATGSSGTPRPSGKPVAIVNRGPTRGDELATVKVDGGCSELLALLADELTPAISARISGLGPETRAEIA